MPVKEANTWYSPTWIQNPPEQVKAFQPPKLDSTVYWSVEWKKSKFWLKCPPPSGWGCWQPIKKSKELLKFFRFCLYCVSNLLVLSSFPTLSSYLDILALSGFLFQLLKLRPLESLPILLQLTSDISQLWYCPPSLPGFFFLVGDVLTHTGEHVK